MTPEERAAQTVAEWEQSYIDSDGFQSAITLTKLVAAAIHAAVNEALVLADPVPSGPGRCKDRAVAGEQERAAQVFIEHAEHADAELARIEHVASKVSWDQLRAEYGAWKYIASQARAAAAVIRARSRGEGEEVVEPGRENTDSLGQLVIA